MKTKVLFILLYFLLYNTTILAQNLIKNDNKLENSNNKTLNDVYFKWALQNINSQGFEASKLKVAKDIVKNNKLTSLQIKKIIDNFAYEQSKLEIAKMAYEYCIDPKNYKIIHDSFKFSQSSFALNNFLQKK